MTNVVDCAAIYKVEMPITDLVYNLLENHLSVSQAVEVLLSRSIREEL